MTLARTQHAVQDYILQDQDAGLSLFGPGARPDIYFNAYRARLAEIVSGEFGVLRGYLGEDAFHTLAQSYVGAVRSSMRDGRDYAAGFPEYLRKSDGASPLIRDIARFEWALRDAFDAADDPVFTVANMGSIDPAIWPDLVFCFHASVQKLDCEHAVADLWQGGLPQADCQRTYVIWRSGLKSMFRTLEPLEAQVLKAALDGANFGALCALIAEQISEAEAPGRAAAILRNWVEPGLITRVEIGA